MGVAGKKTTAVPDVSARDARIYLSKFRKRKMVTAMTTKAKLTMTMMVVKVVTVVKS